MEPAPPRSLPRPAIARREAGRDAGAPGGPVAVVALLPGRAGIAGLSLTLAGLARQEGLAGLRAAPGVLAILVLVPGAGPMIEALAPIYPHPLRAGPPEGRAAAAARRAAAWAAGLGRPGAPLLLPPPGPLPPRWARDRLAALRDGADLVLARWPLGATLAVAERAAPALDGRAVTRPWRALRAGLSLAWA